ncbi:hypothetical protein LWE61_14995 [Sphingobium sufflavum]|uniref:phage adaptor protein n=1 Tax=Sphingobium sufflavum TaxID=1129547 RepID=UPI001F223A2C|nr:hypothetical protein [Sphingobium sufflavum]MCE7797857.1 hypothetical protein [Sphingobium sufflavum]
MADPTDFFRWILPSATTAPEPTVSAHVIDAAQDFCKRTRCWRSRHSITLDGTETDIPCTPEDAVLIDIESSAFDGRPLGKTRYSDAEFGDDGMPWAITQRSPAALQLVPRAQPGKLELSLFLMPAPLADELPDFLRDLHGRDIANGALGTLLAIPNQPFSNPALAAHHISLFERAMDKGFNLSIRGQQRAPARAKSRFM